jgi:hypothetical protein
MVRVVVVVPFHADVAGKAVRNAPQKHDKRFKTIQVRDALLPQLAAVPVHGSRFFQPISGRTGLTFRNLGVMNHGESFSTLLRRDCREFSRFFFRRFHALPKWAFCI